MSASNAPLRVLFVAQAVSIHTARWISQLREQGWDLHIFDMLGSFPHPELRGVTEYSLLRPRRIPQSTAEPDYGHPFFLRIGWDPFPLSLAGYVARRVFRNRADRLASLIRRLKPDVVHSLELQTQSYHLLDVAENLGGSLGAPWIVTTWGSDIFYFQRYPEHLRRIRELLARCDYLIPDCKRDEALARAYGFRGEVPLILPGSGGYRLEEMRQLMGVEPPASRRVIMLKGYQGWAGRAMDALDAVELCAGALRRFEVVVHSASPAVRDRVRQLESRHGLNMRVLPRMPHSEVLRLFGKARVAIGVNVTDGVPNAMLEAMTMGALPIQSDTESTAEWITDGENGLLVEPGNPDAIAEALRRALVDDRLVENAAARNFQLLREKLDISVVQPKVVDMYRRAAADHAGR